LGHSAVSKSDAFCLRRVGANGRKSYDFTSVAGRLSRYNRRRGNDSRFDRLRSSCKLPISHYATPSIHHVECAVGAHIGPLGGCILGNDNPPPVVVERRAADAPDARGTDGCGTKSDTRTDGAGNSETKTKTNC
jgi:hypothetical protein